VLGIQGFFKSKMRGSHSISPLKIRARSLNLPLKVRGTEGGYFHNSPYPSYLKRGNFGKALCVGDCFGPINRDAAMTKEADLVNLAMTKGAVFICRPPSLISTPVNVLTH
jgi:hypothetical protein